MRGAGAATLRALPRLARASGRVPSLSARLARRLLALVAAAGLVAGGYVFWFRDSSLVRVETVTVTGLTTKDAGRVRRALVTAAREMTTLNVRPAELEAAAAGFPVVRSIRARADFPHALRIHVAEHRAVALAASHGAKPIPVAGDGTVLRRLPVDRRLPVVRTRGALPGRRIDERRTLRLLRVAAAAPAVVASTVEGVVATADRGLVARLRQGPELVFGDATRSRAKWTAALRVLTAPSARGATYVDVRLPERPTAGGLPARAEPETGIAAPGAAPPVAPAGPGLGAAGVPANPQP
jgi:cell division protein FtsQ